MLSASGYGLEYRYQNLTKTKKLASAINVASQQETKFQRFVEDTRLHTIVGNTKERSKMSIR